MDALYYADYFAKAPSSTAIDIADLAESVNKSTKIILIIISPLFLR